MEEKKTITAEEAEVALKEMLGKAETVGNFAKGAEDNDTALLCVGALDKGEGTTVLAVGLMGSMEDNVTALLRAMAENPPLRRVVMKAAEGYRLVGPMLKAVQSATPCDCPACKAERAKQN
jgi:hypothetical protein